MRGTWTQWPSRATPATTAPSATLVVGNAAIAIKSSGRRGFDVAGRHYSQIDPRNGQPAGDVLRVAVISANPITADALATAFSVLTPAESVALAATVPDVQFSITLTGGRRIDSPGWRAFEMRPREATPRDGDAPDAVLAARSLSPEGRLFERYL